MTRCRGVRRAWKGSRAPRATQTPTLWGVDRSACLTLGRHATGPCSVVCTLGQTLRAVVTLGRKWRRVGRFAGAGASVAPRAVVEGPRPVAYAPAGVLGRGDGARLEAPRACMGAAGPSSAGGGPRGTPSGRRRAAETRGPGPGPARPGDPPRSDATRRAAGLRWLGPQHQGRRNRSKGLRDRDPGLRRQRRVGRSGQRGSSHTRT